MAQAALAPLDPNTTSGSQLAAKLTAFEQALLSMHSGSSRPAYVQPGTCWRDTSGAVWIVKLYDGVNDIPVGAFLPASSRRALLGATAEIASASTTDVLGQVVETVVITGTETIISFGSTPHQMKFVRFAAALTITRHATSLETPTGQNIVTAAGDSCMVVSDGAGNARIVGFWRAAITTARLASVAEFWAGTAGSLVDPAIRAARNPVTLTDASPIAWNLAAGFDFAVTIASNRAMGDPSGFIYRQSGVIAVTASGAQRTINKSANMKSENIAWPIPIAQNTTAYIYYDALSGTHINVLGVLNNPA